MPIYDRLLVPGNKVEFFYPDENGSLVRRVVSVRSADEVGFQGWCFRRMEWRHFKNAHVYDACLWDGSPIVDEDTGAVLVPAWAELVTTLNLAEGWQQGATK